MARKRQSRGAAPVIPRAGETAEGSAYRAMLAQDLGAPTFASAHAHDDGKPVGLVALVTRPTGLFMLALTMFSAVLIARLWQAGTFDSLWAPKGAVVDRHSRAWMLGHHAPRLKDAPIEDPGSLLPPAAQPAPAPEPDDPKVDPD